MTPAETLAANGDVLRLLAGLMQEGHAEVNRTVMVVHVDRYQADDLLAASELANFYEDRNGHAVHNAWLFGWGTLRIVVDRTVDPHPEVTAILAAFDHEDLPDGAGGYPVGDPHRVVVGL